MAAEMMRHLPAIYQAEDEHSLLAHLLAAFEGILLKRTAGGKARPAIEEVVADLARYFDPRRAPKDFLPWLAGWAALSLRADLTEARLREAITGIIPLYAKRGTRRGIIETVELFTGGKVEVHEPEDIEFQIRDHSTIGKDTYLGGPAPYIFYVHFSPAEQPSEKPEERRRREQLDIEIARAAIEMTKPAHTIYTMRTGQREGSEPAGQREEY